MPPNQTPDLSPQPVTPNQPPAPRSPELLPAVPAAPERAPQVLPAAPQLPGATPPTIPPATVPGPLVALPQSPSVPPVPPTTSPATAGDVDVIEKEWVDQADEIIKRTKDDPYVEEEAVEGLQQDYLKKRYGHEVKKPDGQ